MQIHRQSLTAYGAPLCETVVDAPEPKGTEVLVRISRCGVCHSDLHMQDGYFLLGDGKQLDVRSGRTLPFTLGHEIAGAVESAGPDAGIAPGTKGAVYPWIGCGQCPACKVGDENICVAPRHLGITVDGGYATHVLIPHPRYLIDTAPLTPSYAGALMCSGLTAYAALKRVADRAARAPLLLSRPRRRRADGARARARHVRHRALCRRYRRQKTRGCARRRRASRLRSGRSGARKALLKASGGIYAAIDFAGSDKSLNFATGVLAKGGKVVVTGLIGGGYSTAVAMFPLKAMTIEGTQTGTLAEARELIDLVRAKNIAPPPIAERPLDRASATLDDLRAGKIVGRVVLTT